MFKKASSGYFGPKIKSDCRVTYTVTSGVLDILFHRRRAFERAVLGC